MTAGRPPNGDRAHGVGLLANAGLATLKVIVGWVAGSHALLADAANSVGDIVATSVGWLAFRAARVPADDNHHYGHGKIESLAGLGVGLGLLATGVGIAWSGVNALLNGVTEAPELVAAAVAAVTMLLKGGLFLYVSRVGRALRSPTLLASAADHRADVLAGLAVLVAVIAAQTGYPWLDPAVGAGLGLWVAWLSMPTIRSNLGVLLDKAPPEATELIRALVAHDPDVLGAPAVRLHPLGAKWAVQIVIAVRGTLTVAEADRVRARVTDAVHAADGRVGEVAVVIRPQS